jgi:hypothetical protein
VLTELDILQLVQSVQTLEASKRDIELLIQKRDAPFSGKQEIETGTSSDTIESSAPPTPEPAVEPEPPRTAAQCHSQIKVLKQELKQESYRLKELKAINQELAAQKSQTLVTILTEQLQQLEAVYMMAKQREYDPSLHSEKEHAAATVIQKHLKRTLAVKKYKIRGKNTTPSG